VQGSLTIEQYTIKFVELPQFATYLVTTKDLKAMKFKRGLQPRIVNQVVGFEICNLMDLVSKASMIERTLKINAEYFNQKKRNAPQGSGIEDTLTTPTREDSTHPQEETTLLNSPICKEGANNALCGKPVCYRCGKLGNFSKDCRSPANNSTSYNRSKGQQNSAPARVNALTLANTGALNEVLTDKLLIASGKAIVLFFD
jgi:hypothetical protein